MLANRLATRKFGKIVQQWYPNTKVFVKQRDSRICIGWKTLVRLEAQADGSNTLLHWGLTLAEANGIDPHALQMEYFKMQVRDADEALSCI